MLHDLITIWFHWLQEWGYWGVFVLMALESTIVPVPSEIVMPPAAFWAAQGQMSIVGVILAGTAGSYFGSAISYWVFHFFGKRIIDLMAKLPFVKTAQIAAAGVVVEKYGAMGIFISRLLPVIRHLISIPAGIFKMPFAKFSFVTIAGSFLWCTVLSLWGQRVIGAHPELLNSPADMRAVIVSELASFVIGILILAALYIFVQFKVLRKSAA